MNKKLIEEKIKIQISDPVNLLNSIADTYPSPKRIFMEFIDNSLDDAEELYRENNKYPYEIKMDAIIDIEQKIVTFIDNCRGMSKDNLLRIVKNIGQSDKKNRPWTNGQFGFGMHSFRACAKKMIVITKTKNSKPLKIEVDRDKDVIYGIYELEPTQFKYKSGTKVIIKDFDMEWWNRVTKEELKEEIEKHFEGLLGRDNLEINIKSDGYSLECKPFDYNQVDGISIEKDISKFYDSSKSVTCTFTRGEKLKINLLVTNKLYPNKRAVFLYKGRRIGDIKDISSYRNKSKYKTKLWDQPFLIGFIEADELLEPVITREDFRSTRNRRLVYEKLLEIEDDIWRIIEKKREESKQVNLNKLAGVLESALAQLAREDRIFMRERLGSGDEIGLVESPDSDTVITTTIPPNKSKRIEKTKEKMKEKVKMEKDEKSEKKGKKRKKSGFNIEFSHADKDQITDKSGNISRSSCSEGIIYFYTKHPDFEKRVYLTRQGELKLSKRLIYYLSSIISKHYKDYFYNKYKMQPEIEGRLKMFEDHIDFTCRLEDILQPYANKELYTLEDTE